MGGFNIVPDQMLPLGKPRFASIFTSNMVLQAQKKVSVWGFGTPGDRISVRLGTEEKTVAVKSQGLWTVRFSPRPASYDTVQLRIKSLRHFPGEESCLENIVFGEVWFCSGQSNMELGVGAEFDGPKELENSADPYMRLFLIHKTSSPLPIRNLEASWKAAAPGTVGENGWGGFSAVAFHFGQYLRKHLDCPVGLVQAAYGGSKIHPFLQPSVLRGGTFSAYRQELKSAHRTWLGSMGSARNQVQGGLLPESAARASHPFQAFDQWDSLKVGTAWNAMIHPLLPFALRGVLWYQGESDADNPAPYNEKLAALYKGFRRDFGSSELYLVQIAPWAYGGEHDLVNLWTAQYRFCSTHDVAMASTVDVGDMADIHPIVKRPVGERLARLALHGTYGLLENAGSPEIKSIRKVDQGFVVDFETNGLGLGFSKKALAEGGTVVKGFRLHLADGQAVPVDGSLEENSVRLCSSPESKVLAVSYAWNSAADGNLANSLDEPAFPGYRQL